MIISDGTAKFALMRLGGRGLDCITYPSLLELITDQTRQEVFNAAREMLPENLSDEEWIQSLHKYKKEILRHLETEIDEVIKAEL